MKCEFKILWFEDNYIWFESALKVVQSCISEHKLNPNIIRETGIDFDASKICNQDFDLIIMDYKLADGKFGDKIASLIREQKVLTEILFYSTAYSKMKEALYSPDDPVEGIYCVKRDIENAFPQKIKQLIDKIVRRSENLINLRGYVLDISCDFEERITNILKNSWSILTDDGKKKLNEKTSQKILQICKNIKKFKDSSQSANENVFTFALERQEFTHASRLSLINALIDVISKYPGFENKKEYSDFRGSYTQDVLRYRNAFGHVYSKNDMITIGNDPVELDEDLHKQMRENLIRYDELILYLEMFINQLMDETHESSSLMSRVMNEW